MTTLARMPGGPHLPFKHWLGYRLRFLVRWVGHGCRARTVLFWPHRPHHKTLVFKICGRLGLRITDDPHRRFDLAFYWQNITWQPDYPQLNLLAERGRLVNRACRDISKRRVGETLQAVFGYELNVDPTVWQGPALEKDDRNASKSDVLVDCPLPQARVDHSYQRVIDTETSDGGLEEIRTPVFDHTIPLVYRKRKPLDNRFGAKGVWISSRICETEEVFTPQEVERIVAFTRELGLEFGEIDVLRDRADGRIYIVDANNTPWGPPFIMSPPDIRRAIERLSAYFKERYFPDDPLVG